MSGSFLRSQRLPVTTQTVTGAQWTTEIVQFSSTATPFRIYFVSCEAYNALGAGTAGGFGTAFMSIGQSFSPGGYGAISKTFERTLYWSSLYDWQTRPSGAPGTWVPPNVLPASHLYDGVAPIVSPDFPPRQAHFWERTDGNPEQGMSSVVFSRDPLGALPQTIKWKAVVVGAATNPSENLHRDVNGDFQSLVGAYTLWRVSNEIGGLSRDVATFYEPSSKMAALSVSGHGIGAPITLYTEGPLPIASNPTEVRYSDLRVYDSATGSWHHLLDWRIAGVQDAETLYGYSAGAVPGKITSYHGTAGEYAVNRYVLTGLIPERGDTFASLTFVSVQDVVEGTATYNGPLFGTGPTAQQDANRGWWLLNPTGTIPAALGFAAPEAGVYHFTGDFARSSDTVGAGDGVNVSITKTGATLFGPSFLTDANASNPDSPFAGASDAPYDVTTTLAAGDAVHFLVTAVAGTGADTTAFRVLVSHVRTGREVFPVPKGDAIFCPPGRIYQNALLDTGGIGRLTGLHSLRHEVFFFSDADNAEIWNTLPNGTVAVAIGQSESDSGFDIQARLNTSGQLAFESAAGNRKLWLHTFSRGGRFASRLGSNVPPVAKGQQGFVPRGTGVFTNDLTLQSNNLANGRIINLKGYRHRVVGFKDLLNEDFYVGKRGIVATAFQVAGGINSRVATKIIARDRRSTTVQFRSGSSDPEVSGWLHTWSK